MVVVLLFVSKMMKKKLKTKTKKIIKRRKIQKLSEEVSIMHTIVDRYGETFLKINFDEN